MQNNKQENIEEGRPSKGNTWCNNLLENSVKPPREE